MAGTSLAYLLNLTSTASAGDPTTMADNIPITNATYLAEILRTEYRNVTKLTQSTVTEPISTTSTTSIQTTTDSYVTNSTSALTEITSAEPNATVVMATTAETHHPPGLHLLSGPDNSDADIQALVYVFAVVVFYGLVLMIALMGMRVRKRRVARMDEGYAALIDRNEVVRRDTALRQKMNVLRLSGVQDGHLLDQIPEHAV